MDAPLYPPAAAFEQPVTAPFRLGAETISLAELMRWPAGWAVVLKHAPAFKKMVQSPQLKPQLGNFTVDSFITYGVIDQTLVDAIDADLAAIPRAEWPPL